MNTYPLVVDLDGTLVNTDMLHESAIKIFATQPHKLFTLPYWLSRGKAKLKQYFAKHSEFDITSLPYNLNLLHWLKEQHQAGRKLILCTASDTKIANAIANHLGIFSEVLASDGTTNLSGKQKAQLLIERFGQNKFDYVGNSRTDLIVWQNAYKAIIVNASKKIINQAHHYGNVEKIFHSPSLNLSVWRRVLRVHQWLKNFLLFIPLLASHQLANLNNWQTLFLAFFSFSFCASAVYIANDLLDLEHDRQHPRKRLRPFAAGLLPVWLGVVLLPLLLFSSFLLANQVNNHFTLCLAIYLVFTCAYSWKLKRLVIIDCLMLALLYTLRIITGAIAISMPLSFWLLTFASFLFLSLAFVKRYAELQTQAMQGKEKLSGRNYYIADRSIIQMLGISAGFSATLVLALYLNSDVIKHLYQTPEIIWGTIPVMLFWISWIWLQAHRGEMHDDPMVFAIKDKASLVAGIIFTAILFFGTIGWPWQ